MEQNGTHARGVAEPKPVRDDQRLTSPRNRLPAEEAFALFLDELERLLLRFEAYRI